MRLAISPQVRYIYIPPVNSPYHIDDVFTTIEAMVARYSEKGNVTIIGDTVQITFIFIGQTRLVFGKRVCTCATKHSNAFRTFLNWLKNSKRVWHEPKLHISRLPLFANFDL